ncbi:helix-turn-helix transcriptional regulator [Actinoplanes sp. NPDC023714]|uniref:PadR family transcriptional regulator n=1 Tax=Actinoplanes sp. NPDC023714 TaxID=3154322 RepID=UPI003400169A
MQEPTFLILTALAARPLHGYGIVQAVLDLSGGDVKLRPGTLYGALDRLADQGLIEVEREEAVEGRLRRYYRLSDSGAATLVAEVGRLRQRASAAETQLRQRPGAVPGLSRFAVFSAAPARGAAAPGAPA